MKINMTSKDGVTLLTAGKYCTEDIEVTPTFETGGGGSDIVVEVNELPIENIDESKIYVVNKISDINVYYCYGDGYMSLAEAVASSIDVMPTVYYKVVSELPANPTATDLQAFNPIYCYIYNNVPYVYGNAGSGDTWLTVSALFSQMGVPIEDKGRTYDIASETEAGLYVYYEDKKVGTDQNNGAYVWNGTEWYKGTNIEAFRNSLIEYTDIGEARCYKDTGSTRYYKITKTSFEQIAPTLLGSTRVMWYYKYTADYRVDYGNKLASLTPSGVANWLYTDFRDYMCFMFPGSTTSNSTDGLIQVDSFNFITFSPNRNVMRSPANGEAIDEIPLTEWEQALIDSGIDMEAVAEKEAEFNS